MRHHADLYFLLSINNRGTATSTSRREAVAGEKGQPGTSSEETRSQDIEQAAAVFALPDADGSAEGDPPEAQLASSKRCVRKM